MATSPLSDRQGTRPSWPAPDPPRGRGRTANVGLLERCTGRRLGAAAAAEEPSTDTPGSARRLTAEARKAILDQRVAAAVARGGQVEWWSRGSLEPVVSYHRYLQGRRWDYAFPLLVLLLFVTRSATGELLGGLGVAIALGVIGSWFGRTKYERITVDEHGGVKVAGAGLLAVAAGATLLAALDGTVFGGAHLLGVMQTATTRGYAYDFRLASLLLLGITMVFGGVLCLTSVRGLTRGQRRAWDRGMIGAILMVLVTVPITPLPVQGELAGGVTLFGVVGLIGLVAAWRQLDVADERGARPSPSSTGRSAA